MNSQDSKLVAVGASILMTLAIASPAIADDTELLLVSPTTSNATPPNIMFIIDTSGSMGDSVNTTQPYESTDTYSGICEVDRIYWTKLDVVPSCTGNTQYVAKTDFLCNDAILRMSGIGAYTGIMVQYRNSGGGLARWQEFEIGNTSDDIECENDSGVHGDGSNSDFYAQAGSAGPGVNQFTNDSSTEISWGSGDAAQVYTTYDGNYLNWLENPVTVSLPKLDIVKAVNRNLMNAIEDVNIGVMRFNNSEGGRILVDVDLMLK
jgi:type IV pilus assembly protein PilY1